MSFDVAAEAYEAFMGRWSRQLSPPFLERSGLRRGDRLPVFHGQFDDVATARSTSAAGRAS